jgi:hypothetical protein
MPSKLRRKKSPAIDSGPMQVAQFLVVLTRVTHHIAQDDGSLPDCATTGKLLG